MSVDVRDLAVMDDGSPAPDGADEQDILYPCCFRDASEIRPQGAK
jgi:hypothetical protein